MDGIFKRLIGRRAFVDRIGISLHKRVVIGKARHIRIERNTTCLGENSFYARYATGVCRTTGNPFRLLYGKASPFPRVPLAQLTLHSERTPITAAEVFLLVRDLTGGISSCRVNYAELTFDLREVSQQKLSQQIASIAKRRTSLVDERGWRTLYFGSPQSERQIRLYQKTADVVRLEIVLRLRSLVRLGIRYPEQIRLLQETDFRQFITVRNPRLLAFKNALVRKVEVPFKRQAWQDLASHFAFDLVSAEFERDYGYEPGWFSRHSPVDDLIRRMQSRLIF